MFGYRNKLVSKMVSIIFALSDSKCYIKPKEEKKKKPTKLNQNAEVLCTFQKSSTLKQHACYTWEQDTLFLLIQ